MPRKAKKDAPKQKQKQSQRQTVIVNLATRARRKSKASDRPRPQPPPFIPFPVPALRGPEPMVAPQPSLIQQLSELRSLNALLQPRQAQPEQKADSQPSRLSERQRLEALERERQREAIRKTPQRETPNVFIPEDNEGGDWWSFPEDDKRPPPEPKSYSPRVPPVRDIIAEEKQEIGPGQAVQTDKALLRPDEPIVSMEPSSSSSASSSVADKFLYRTNQTRAELNRMPYTQKDERPGLPSLRTYAKAVGVTFGRNVKTKEDAINAILNKFPPL